MRPMARPPPTAYERAVALLARRERTRAALRAALLARGHPEAEVDEALGRVQALGYLDDARVALARAKRELAAGRGRADVARRLSAQGVDEALAARATRDAGVEQGHDDEAAARALLKKRGLSGPKAARLLASRGFDEALVRRVTGVEED